MYWDSNSVGEGDKSSLDLQFSLWKLNFSIKSRYTGIQTQQARETRARWTDISIHDSLILVLKLNKLGFQPSKQGRQQIPGLIFQSMIVKF